MTDQPDRHPSPLTPAAPRRAGAFWVLGLVGLLLVGLAVRLYDLDDPPLDFHPTRQLHSLIMARGMYYEQSADVADWQRERAVQQWRAEGVIEPPLLERLVAFTYRLAGGEVLYAGRVYSSLFWLAGAFALYLLCRMFFTAPASLAGLGFALALPYAVYASRAFQPDPLMAALVVWSWWGMARWLRAPGWQNALIAGLLGGAALLVKGTALFLVAGGWVGALLAARGLRGSLRSGQVWVMALLAALPYAVYSAWGLWGSGFLQEQFSLRFFPQYWVDPAFYLRWFNLLEDAIGLPWLALGLLGALWLPSRLARGLGWGAWTGYLLMGFALSHHISTHDYYSLPLIPMIGLGLAGLVEAARRVLPEPRRWMSAASAVLLLAVFALSAWQARTALKRADYRSEPAFWANLAGLMGRDAGVAGITQDYGARLAYWGWITPSNWLTAAEFELRRSAGQQFDLAETFAGLTVGKEFFLVTLPEELNRQPELRAYLESGFPVFADGPGYLIYDLRHPLASGGGE